MANEKFFFSKKAVAWALEKLHETTDQAAYIILYELLFLSQSGVSFEEERKVTHQEITDELNIVADEILYIKTPSDKYWSPKLSSSDPSDFWKSPPSTYISGAVRQKATRRIMPTSRRGFKTCYYGKSDEDEFYFYFRPISEIVKIINGKLNLEISWAIIIYWLRAEEFDAVDHTVILRQFCSRTRLQKQDVLSIFELDYFLSDKMFSFHKTSDVDLENYLVMLIEGQRISENIHPFLDTQISNALVTKSRDKEKELFSIEEYMARETHWYIRNYWMRPHYVYEVFSAIFPILEKRKPNYNDDAKIEIFEAGKELATRGSGLEETHYKKEKLANWISYFYFFGFLDKIDNENLRITKVGYKIQDVDDPKEIIKDQFLKWHLPNWKVRTKYDSFDIWPFIFTIEVCKRCDGYITKREFVNFLMQAENTKEISLTVKLINLYRNKNPNIIDLVIAKEKSSPKWRFEIRRALMNYFAYTDIFDLIDQNLVLREEAREISPNIPNFVSYRDQEYKEWFLDEMSLEDVSVKASESTSEALADEELDDEVITEDKEVPIDFLSFQQLKKYLTSLDLYFHDRVLIECINALRNGNHVIITGKPGTGKTTLAVKLAQIAKNTGIIKDYIVTTATSSWTTFDTIGGYLPKENSRELDYHVGVLHKALIEDNWIIIDEINRADIDKAFGPFFTTLAGFSVRLPERSKGENIVIPAFKGETNKFRIIATMNTADQASLFSLSYAFLRRFVILEIDFSAEDFQNLAETWNISKLEKTSREACIKLLNLWDTNNFPKLPLGPAVLKDFLTTQIGMQQEQLNPPEAFETSFRMHILPQLSWMTDVEKEKFRELMQDRLLKPIVTDSLRMRVNKITETEMSF